MAKSHKIICDKCGRPYNARRCIWMGMPNRTLDTAEDFNRDSLYAYLCYECSLVVLQDSLHMLFGVLKEDDPQRAHYRNSDGSGVTQALDILMRRHVPKLYYRRVKNGCSREDSGDS